MDWYWRGRERGGGVPLYMIVFKYQPISTKQTLIRKHLHVEYNQFLLDKYR